MQWFKKQASARKLTYDEVLKRREALIADLPEGQRAAYVQTAFLQANKDWREETGRAIETLDHHIRLVGLVPVGERSALVKQAMQHITRCHDYGEGPYQKGPRISAAYAASYMEDLIELLPNQERTPFIASSLMFISTAREDGGLGPVAAKSFERELVSLDVPARRPVHSSVCN